MLSPGFYGVAFHGPGNSLHFRKVDSFNHLINCLIYWKFILTDCQHRTANSQAKHVLSSSHASPPVIILLSAKLPYTILPLYGRTKTVQNLQYIVEHNWQNTMSNWILKSHQTGSRDLIPRPPFQICICTIMPAGNVVSVNLRVKKGLFDRRSQSQSKPVNGTTRLDGEKVSKGSEAGADCYDPGLRRYDSDGP